MSEQVEILAVLPVGDRGSEPGDLGPLDRRRVDCGVLAGLCDEDRTAVQL